jgi:hypothetical protein
MLLRDNVDDSVEDLIISFHFFLFLFFLKKKKKKKKEQRTKRKRKQKEIEKQQEKQLSTYNLLVATLHHCKKTNTYPINNLSKETVGQVRAVLIKVLTNGNKRR